MKRINKPCVTLPSLMVEIRILSSYGTVQYGTVAGRVRRARCAQIHGTVNKSIFLLYKASFELG